MNVWIRARSAGFSDSPARSMSAGLQRASAATTGPRISPATSFTACASSSDAIGKPASMMSTPSAANCLASVSFSSVFIENPGDCSPSRRVVSKIISRSFATAPPDCNGSLSH